MLLSQLVLISCDVLLRTQKKTHKYISWLTFIEGDFLGAEGEACLEVEAEDTRMSCFFSPP
jgi:hypothetical protein